MKYLWLLDDERIIQNLSFLIYVNFALISSITLQETY